MRGAVIVSTARTPIGRACRVAFDGTQAQELAGHAIGHAVGRAGVVPAAAICANAPLAVRENLAVARQATELEGAALRVMSSGALDRLSSTEDFAEGLRAFVEKRPPRWQGR